MTDSSITPPQECTGCALCANVCAHDAIRMKWNMEGFLVPEVNTEACINCGACVKNCPAQPEHLDKLHRATPTSVPMGAYGAWHKDKDTHIQSSSGGIFSALAEQFFSKGGCVFGVVWANKDTAVFSKAENMDELAAMRGSKYTQAIPGDVYRQVKTELRKGRQVLFCGTSCQVYALKRFLRKEYANLLLVDILCHGVPSRLLLQSYIREYEKQERKELTRIHFRQKAGNWQQYQVKKTFRDGSSVSHHNWDDMFIRIFIADFALNKACYNCPHTRLPRVGDITLGDFWGDLHTLHPDWPIPDGIESILANTPQGHDLLQDLKDNSITLHSVPFKELYDGQPFTYQRGETSPPALRKKALNLLKQHHISSVYHFLLEQEHYGPFSFRRGGILHRIYQKIRHLKHRIYS